MVRGIRILSCKGTGRDWKVVKSSTYSWQRHGVIGSWAVWLEQRLKPWWQLWAFMNKMGNKIPIDAIWQYRHSKYHTFFMEGIMTCSYFWLKVWESLGKINNENNETIDHTGLLTSLSLVLGSVGAEHSPRWFCGNEQRLSWIWTQVLWTPMPQIFHSLLMLDSPSLCNVEWVSLCQHCVNMLCWRCHNSW